MCSRQNSAQCDTAQSHVFCEYLRENEFFCETILDCLSGTQMGWINEKRNIKKPRDTASLRGARLVSICGIFYFLIIYNTFI